MPSELQRVAQELVDCLDLMPRVVAALHERARKCREAAGYVGGLSSGSPTLQAAVQHLDAAAADCEEAAHLAMAAHQRGRGWALEKVGGGGGPPAGGRQEAGRPAPGRGNPVAQRIIRDKLPVRSDPLAKTHGLWLGRGGENRDLVSGYDGHSDAADSLREQLGIPPITAVSHVEVKFAMFMRERGLRNETIYINNAPCRGLQSCWRYLESFLPKGSRLTVHWPDSEPRTFEGKGPE